MTMIIHLTSQDAWLSAVEAGQYQAESLSAEGFIHCSTGSQIVDVANAFYHGQRGLVLLVLDPKKLSSELKWEPPAHSNPESAAQVGDELFPHLYGPLNLEAVTRVIPFEPDAEGTFTLPTELSG